jgi:hypothetical protein
MKSETIPLWLWRLALVVLSGAILSIALLLVLALGGISNPGRIGALVVRDDLDRDAGWALRRGDSLAGVKGKIISGVYEVALPHNRAHALVVAPYQAHPPCTIMIAARQIDGPTDAGYGLWWGDASGEGYHVAAVNGDGYLTIFQSVNGDTEAIIEWQVFPRIRPQGETNTLQVDISGGQVLVRVNDEVAVSFEWMPDRPLETGFYVETLSAGGTTVDFDWLSIWQETGK